MVYQQHVSKVSTMIPTSKEMKKALVENMYIMLSKILMLCVQKMFIHYIVLSIKNIHKKDINLCYPMDFNHKFILWGIVKNLTYIKNCCAYLFRISCNPGLRMISYIQLSLLLKVTLWHLSWIWHSNLSNSIVGI